MPFPLESAELDVDMEVTEVGGVTPLPVVEERWDDETGDSTARFRDLVLDETDMGPSETLEVEQNDPTAWSSAFVRWRFAE